MKSFFIRASSGSSLADDSKARLIGASPATEQTGPRQATASVRSGAWARTCGFDRRRHRDRPGQRAGLAAAHDRFAQNGQRLAPARRVHGHRLVELDHDLDRPGLQRFPQMRHQLHVAIPGIERPEFAPHRHAVNADIGDGDRLHRHVMDMAGRILVPTAASAAPISALLNGSTQLPSFDVPSGNSTSASPASSRSRIWSRACARLRAAHAIDEHGLLKPRERGEERPSRTSALATKETRATADRTRMSSQEV